MKKIISEYQNITASRELKERIEKIMTKERRKTRTKRTFGFAASCAACLLLAFAVFMNLFPSAVYAIGDIPVLGSLVRVVTFGRYENHDMGYEAKITTPKIEGLLDKELEDRLNAEFKDNAKALIAAYEKDVRDLKREFGDEETIHMGVESDYIVKTDNDDILALDVYILNIAGSSSTVHTYYTIDKKTGRQLTLKGLFKDGADYVTPLSEYIIKQMKYENEHNDGLFWVEDNEYTEGFKKIAEDQKFYINDRGELVICFDKYDVAAGAQGCPEFVIPNGVIADIYNGY